MGYIYKITNIINGKIYIGQTHLNPPEKRWKHHLNDRLKPNAQNRPLYKDMNMYGVDKFEFCVLEKVENEKLLEKEKYYIEKYRTYIGFDDCNGYNATLGGDGKHTLTIDKQRIIQCYEETGVIDTVAKKYNIDPKSVRRILNENNIIYLQGQDKRDYHYYLKYGGVAQVDSNNKIIDIYRSINEIIKEHPTYNGKTIGTVLKRGNFAYGFHWYRLIDLPRNCTL